MTDTDKGKYLLLISVHGLIRGHDLELGRDADTGGQTKYVVDLARALARHPDVGEVLLVTRLIVDEAVGPDYAREEEPLADGARIIRIPCGPDEYIPKEQLWDYLDSFTDNLMHWLQTQLWYDGLAIAVPEVTSQGSVILMLVLILILETPRRGLILGKKVKFHKRFMQVVREYHGYIISWAIIYTFWYHPMENTLGHLAGFFYIFLLLELQQIMYGLK